MELAEIDEVNRGALSDAESLNLIAISPYTFILIGFVLGLIRPEFTVSPAFIAIVCIGVFWFRYFKWSRDYASNRFPDEVFSEALSIRRQSVAVVILASILLAALLYVRMF